MRKTKQGNTSQERSIIKAAASVISSIKDNEELASKYAENWGFSLFVIAWQQLLALVGNLF